ncbi:hypothetical protein CP10139811_0249 [Chlamydia ibidis]|uniref:Uncharacterized protein n=1 Tax=Chlamydia ibidis TaxID=1405396 RepID=S7J3Q9_9CHLA|nr:hypothetical protein CP10139811_0249 [Chlamydia ibidis]
MLLLVIQALACIAGFSQHHVPEKTFLKTPELNSEPILDNDLLEELSERLSYDSEVRKLSNPYIGEYLTNSSEWESFFMKSPEFFLQSTLNSWTLTTKGNRIILTHPQVGFRLTIVERGIEINEVENESVGYVYQLPEHIIAKCDLKNGRAHPILMTIKNRNHYLCFSPSSIPQIPCRNENEILYQLFHSAFSQYYIVLSEAVATNEVISLELIRSNTKHPLARPIELLAFFCAIEQLRFTKRTKIQTTSVISENPQEVVPYLLSPKDYWKILVEKQGYTFPIAASPFGLLPNEKTDTTVLFRDNKARFMVTKNITIKNILVQEPYTLIDLVKTFCSQS